MKKITLLLITLLMLTCFSSAADYTLTEKIGGISVKTTVPEGRVVTLTFTKASTFTKWQVNSGTLAIDNPTSTSITFSMPANDVEIEAIEEVQPIKQSLSVCVDGEIMETSEIAVGQSITVTAVEGNGKTFASWQITGLTGANATSNPLTFTMPNNDVEIIATFGARVVIANNAVPVGAYIEYVPTATSAKVYDTDTGYTTTNSYQEFNPSATTSWRVMYNNNGQLDIVSADGVYATNGSGLYLQGATGYAKLVDTLNNLCSQYVNTTYATSGRSIGCTSSSVGKINTTTYPLTWDYTYNEGNTGLPYTDTYYTTDVNQLKNNSLLHSSGCTWLASRSLFADSKYSYFDVRFLRSDGDLYATYLCYVYSDGRALEPDGVNGVRPVVSLKSGIQITGGSGTVGDPYIILSN